MKYPVHVKPGEINLYASGPRVHKPGQNQNNGMSMYGPGQPQQPMAFPAPGPYGFYPSLYHPAHAWYSQLPPLNLNPALQAGIHMDNPRQPIGPIPTKSEVPNIRPWLKYCDKHPERRGENFIVHAGKFDEEGYHRINQLTGDRISVEKLSSWLSIGKGTADLLIQYAVEDMELVKAGAFSMGLGDGLDGEQRWI